MLRKKGIIATRYVCSEPHLHINCLQSTQGAIINVFGRDLMLLDCDSYTREWYADKYGPSFLGKSIEL